ncbi:hypothetical protein N9R79_03605 [Vibrio sp.]|nr:hypothetical protein [Vibrio sp.]
MNFKQFAIIMLLASTFSIFEAVLEYPEILQSWPMLTVSIAMKFALLQAIVCAFHLWREKEWTH